MKEIVPVCEVGAIDISPLWGYITAIRAISIDMPPPWG